MIEASADFRLAVPLQERYAVYQLDDDLSESTNLADQYTERIAAMTNELNGRMVKKLSRSIIRGFSCSGYR